jgi:hypothetical protein
MTCTKLGVGGSRPEDWSDDTAIDLSPERLEIIEGARERARAKRLKARQRPAQGEPESGVVRKAAELPED